MPDDHDDLSLRLRVLERKWRGRECQMEQGLRKATGDMAKAFWQAELDVHRRCLIELQLALSPAPNLSGMKEVTNAR